MKEISPHRFNATTPDKFRALLDGPADIAARWLYTAAEHGIAEAQLHYAQRLLDGNGMAQNPQEAFQWFKLAAAQKHPMAMNMLGRCYENGWGIQVDPLLATYWFRLAAHANLDWGMYNYATSLALGRGVAVDRGEAFQWLRKAVAMGHMKSWNLLGGFYEDGWEVEADLDAAEECYRAAAEGGDFRGQFNYGRLLARQGRMRDATAWFRMAASNPAITKPFREKMCLFLSQTFALDKPCS
ncbi:tetratricopeptide repeat protein [Parapusillimonas sp. JC17]|uniref:tetratricopeptide repeat protein n=1 Tax=Parapusillimonas sp. JC17 TaxID=3445768 RepID=UPI003F9FA716